MESAPRCKAGSASCSNSRSRRPAVSGVAARQRNPVHWWAERKPRRPEGPAPAGKPGTAKEISLTCPLGESLLGHGRSDPDLARQGAESKDSTTDPAVAP